MSTRILSFDIEDWFHLLDVPTTRSPASWAAYESRVERGTERILEELGARGTKATFFCLGWIAEKYPQLIRRIDAAGHEIGTHSQAHQLVYEQSPREFEEDLKRSIGLLEALTAKPVRIYRAPGFSITQASAWAFDLLLANGIEVDCSIFPASRAHGGYAGFVRGPSWIDLPTGRLKELPLNLGRFLGRDVVFSGGGYFRLLPYPVIRQQLRRSDYVMTYFHPRDFDAGQPIVEGLSRARRFKSYVGLGGAFGKLRRMLDEFDFVEVGSAVAELDWSRAPVLKLEALRKAAPAGIMGAQPQQPLARVA